MSLVALHGVNVSLGRELVLQNIDFAIERGEIVTIVGPNGSGKTTLLRVLIGALRPGSGRVERMPGLSIGYVPQRLHIDRTLPITVRRFLDLPHVRSADEAHEALDRAGVPTLGARQMSGLSVGQFQRVLLARALLARPDLLVLDEATQGLDPTGSASFFRQIEGVRDEFGCAVLMVSHELHVVMSASDRVICLNGHVCCEGSPEIVSSRPEYQSLFGTGTGGAFALYRHDHDHTHGEDHLSPTAIGTPAAAPRDDAGSSPTGAA